MRCQDQRQLHRFCGPRPFEARQGASGHERHICECAAEWRAELSGGDLRASPSSRQQHRRHPAGLLPGPHQRWAAMAQLELEHEEDLFLLMAQAHLPMPRLSEPATGAMVAELEALPRH